MKTILFFQTGSSETARLKFEGVASFARTVGWDARIITNASTRQPLGKILSFWKPAGCIVEASGGAQGLSPSAFGKTRTGHMAAELLSRILEGEKVLGHFTVPPDGLVRRASSRVFHREDKSAKKAVETIHRRARDGLKPSDILALFDCSRRLAEIRFKAATGKTITEEIQSVRMDAVYELLARPEVPISVIAARCGWPSDSFLRRIFRRKTGHSLSEERARLTKDTIAQAGRH